MTKKSQGHTVHYENQSGCMWSFISILDFRTHSTRKLLSGKPSVKKLMEEEMLGEIIRNVEVKKKQVDNENQMTKGQKRKKTKTGTKKKKKSGNVQCHEFNASGNSGSQQSCHQNSEQQSVSNLNVDAIISEFCSQLHRESISCEEHNLDGEIEMKSTSKHCEVIKVFINQKCCNEDQLEENGKSQNHKALMDALEILRTDKELFLALLQDSNSNDVEKSKSNQEIDNPVKPELILRKKQNFFRRMIKSPDRNSLNRNEDSQDSNRIVFLKPGSYHITKDKDPSARSASHVFFSGIKRRLKHAIGMEHQNPGSYGKGVVGEDGGMSSPTKDHFFMERIVKPSMASRMRDKERKSKESEIGMVNDSEQRVSNIYVEAKKHLSDMLSNGDEDESASNRLLQKSLGRILSLPEYNTPMASPGREQEQNFIATQTSDNLEAANESTLTQNMEAQTCSSGGDSCDSSSVLDSDPNISEGVVHEDEKEITISVMDETSSGGDVEIVKTTDDIAKEEEIDAMDASAETIDGKGYSEDLQEDVYENQPQSSPLASSSRFSIAQKVEDPKNAIDVHEEKESILEYVKVVLQACGLNMDELYMRSLSSDQLLDPTLLSEIDFFSNELCHDKKLLFYCMNEVLMEAYVQHFGCSHWVPFVKPRISHIPNMKNAIQGVWEGICWHLLPKPLPQTLEQVVGKDMARSGTWMDLCLDVESICTEISEIVFEELMEDTVISGVVLKETESSIS